MMSLRIISMRSSLPSGVLFHGAGKTAGETGLARQRLVSLGGKALFPSRHGSGDGHRWGPLTGAAYESRIAFAFKTIEPTQDRATLARGKVASHRHRIGIGDVERECEL